MISRQSILPEKGVDVGPSLPGTTSGGSPVPDALPPDLRRGTPTNNKGEMMCKVCKGPLVGKEIAVCGHCGRR